jgi:hypothetical protein
MKKWFKNIHWYFRVRLKKPNHQFHVHKCLFCGVTRYTSKLNFKEKIDLHI